MIQPETILVDKDAFDAATAQAAQDAQAQAQAAQQAQDPAQNPSVIAAQERTKAAQIDSDARIQVAEMNRETEMIKLAQHYDISIEQLKTKLDLKQLDLTHKEKMLVGEAEIEDELASRAHGRNKELKGSGGYVSQ
jgi:predicted NAD-dependent protein-ADP-ribosyltransferase YbiA (DUF1768 family)